MKTHKTNRYYCKNPNSKVHYYFLESLCIALIAIIITIYTPIADNIGIVLIAIILSFSYAFLLFTLVDKTIGIIFYDDNIRFIKLLRIRKIKYEDISAICITREHTQGRVDVDTSSVKISFKNGKIKLIEKPIYLLSLLTCPIEEKSDYECLRVADVIANSVNLKKMRKHRIGYYMYYEEIIKELYQRQQYPIYIAEKAFKDNRAHIFSALKESGAANPPRILMEKDYIIINPRNTENDRNKGYRY